MDGTEEVFIDLSMTSDAQLADIVLEVTDELQARAARYAPHSKRYEQAATFVDWALEELKAQIREDS